MSHCLTKGLYRTWFLFTAIDSHQFKELPFFTHTIMGKIFSLMNVDESFSLSLQIILLFFLHSFAVIVCIGCDRKAFSLPRITANMKKWAYIGYFGSQFTTWSDIRNLPSVSPSTSHFVTTINQVIPLLNTPSLRKITLKLMRKIPKGYSPEYFIWDPDRAGMENLINPSFIFFRLQWPPPNKHTEIHFCHIILWTVSRCCLFD